MGANNRGWLLLVFFTCFFSVSTAAIVHGVENHLNGLSAKTVSIPFVQNVGQLKDKEACYYGDIFSGRVTVGRHGDLTYTFVRGTSGKATDGVVARPKMLPPAVFRERPVFALDVNPTGMEPSATRVHAFKGNHPSQWRTDIPTFHRIRFEKMWPGVRMDLRATGSSVEKIFTIAPGTDPDKIRLAFDKDVSLALDETGNLAVKSEQAVATFTKPVAFQDHKGVKKPVQVAYRLLASNQYGFALGPYDRSRPLVIDPLLAGTWFGEENGYGWFDETLAGMTRDAAGNIYAVGEQGEDALVLKFSPDLSTLLASATLGGSYPDYGQAIAVDGSGNVLITGGTQSTPALGFPVTPGAYDTTHNGAYGGHDGFVAKFGSDLSTLVACTYLGGDGDKQVQALAVTTTGQPVVAGQTDATDMISQATAYDSSHNGYLDMFVAIFSSDLTLCPASTYVGGTGYDYCHGMALDGSDRVYLAGQTSSSDYPTTQGAQQEAMGAGTTDAVFSRLDTGLRSLQSSTFMGVPWRAMTRARSSCRPAAGPPMPSAPPGQRIFRSPPAAMTR